MATRYCFKLKKAVTFEECYKCKKCDKWRKNPFDGTLDWGKSE